jgi:hypothetical protein
MTVGSDGAVDPDTPANFDVMLGRTKLDPPPEDELRKKWLSWIELIDKDLTMLATHRMIWRGLNEVWTQREPPLPFSHLFSYLARTYAHSQAAGIRRHGDVHRDAAGLTRLLRDIKSHPDRISREFYVSRFTWGQQHIGDKQFEAFDPKRSGFLNPDLAAADLVTLEQAAEKAKTWVDNNIAHLSASSSDEVPTIEELDNALDVIGDIFIRWNAVLTGAGLVSIQPSPQYDWAAPLRVPWILGDVQ